MSPTKHILSLSLLIASVFGGACATHQPRPAETPAPGNPELSDSSVDISYVLGHNHRRFLIRAKDMSCVAQSYYDHQILKENTVDQKHYSDFLSKASLFIATPHRVPAEQAASSNALPESEDICRTPFTVTVRVGTAVKATHGCRVSDDGALSHLVRDGEFLLFTRK